MEIIPMLLDVTKPVGLWTKLINSFYDGIGNFGWTILIVTLLVKIVVSPLDFFVKLNTKRQTLIQQKCAPQIAKIQKKFGKDQNSVKIQTNSLYKREGLNVGSGCLIMAVNVIITIIIFFSFYNSLRQNSAYQAISQYERLTNVYTQANYDKLIEHNSEIDGYDITSNETAEEFVSDFNLSLKIKSLKDSEEDKSSEIENLLKENYEKNILKVASNIVGFEVKDIETAKSFIEEYELAKQVKTLIYEDDETGALNLIEGKSHDKTYYENLYNDNSVLVESIKNKNTNEYFSTLFSENEDLITDISEQSSQLLLEEWDKIKSSWLWVDNIWVADATIYPFPTYSNLVQIATSGGYSEYFEENVNEEYYNTISEIINSKSGRKNNGFYILAVLAGLVTFASQYIAEYHTKLKNKKAKNLAAKTADQSAQMTTKVMKLFMPIIMIIFVLQSSASFGIYILASNIIGILTGEISTIIINKITKSKQEEVEAFLEKEAERLIKKGKL